MAILYAFNLNILGCGQKGTAILRGVLHNELRNAASDLPLEDKPNLGFNPVWGLQPPDSEVSSARSWTELPSLSGTTGDGREGSHRAIGVHTSANGRYFRR